MTILVISLIAIPLLYAVVMALLITISRRSQRAFAAANQNLARAEFITMAVPAADNAGVGPVTGEPLMFGQSPAGVLAAVAENSYTPPTGIPTGNVGCAFIGAFLLSVTAKSGLSPSVNKAIAPGDKVYADGGTYDATTGCTYGFTLDANSGGAYFGNALDAVVAGATTTIRVRLKVTG